MSEGGRSEVVCMSCGATGEVAAKDEPMPTFGAAGETVEADGVYTGRGPGKPPGR